jgi:hypothetical protein
MFFLNFHNLLLTPHLNPPLKNQSQINLYLYINDLTKLKKKFTLINDLFQSSIWYELPWLLFFFKKLKKKKIYKYECIYAHIYINIK